MAHVLFLAHRYPYPPNKGDKIRAFHAAEHLSGKHEVSLACIVGPGDEEPDTSWARRKLRAFQFGRVSSFGRMARAAAALVSGAPLSVAVFHDPRLAAWVGWLMRERPPDFVYVFSSAMAQYLPQNLPKAVRLIVDFVDVDAEKWRQYALAQVPPMRWIYALEARRLRRFDRLLAARADAALFVSPDERRLFDAMSPETSSKHLVVANGVDAKYFDPAAIGAPAQAKAIVFVGVMDYWPNVDAVIWFTKEVLPLVRESHGDAWFQIVGARPSGAVRQLAQAGVVEVTGAVPDVRPYLAAAQVVVAPLRIARGIQNKVLEGMAMARPVVATPGALEGIAAERGRHLLVGETAREIAEAVISVLDGRSPPGLGAAARSFVVANHDWSASLRKLDELMAVRPGCG